MKITSPAALAFLFLSTTAALADDTLHVDHIRAFATAPTAMSGGGFMSITNHGDQDDALIGIRADFPRVELHTTAFADGIARMMHVDEIAIPAGETVTLAPGGFHVMFMGLQGTPLTEGESFPATLIFEQAGEVAVTFDIVARTMDHGNQQDHSGHMNHGN